MAYKKIGYIRQTWYVLKYAVQSWLEWQDIKCWAREYHPAWLEMAVKAKSEDVRQEYKLKLIEAYRGAEYV